MAEALAPISSVACFHLASDGRATLSFLRFGKLDDDRSSAAKSSDRLKRMQLWTSAA